METKTFVVKETKEFRLRVKVTDCISPEGMKSVEFVQEHLDDRGNVRDTSTYNFHLTDAELGRLINGLEFIKDTND